MRSLFYLVLVSYYAGLFLFKSFKISAFSSSDTVVSKRLSIFYNGTFEFLSC
jgi:hypothetical protein